MYQPSTRAEVITRRTYNRPLNDEGTVFETWAETVDRVIGHQKWLWERAAGRELVFTEINELEELRALMLERKVSTSGRTLWLGGTDVAQRREASQFNCAFTSVQTVYDVVDVLWLLLQGCGVGFNPRIGVLNGFKRRIPKITVIRSERTDKGGKEHNEETFVDGVWTIKVGDSAEAWARSIGKLLAGKYNADELVLDFSEIRPAGQRLSGYGWISSGDGDIARAYTAIAAILNKRAGQLLTRINILDVINHLGTILSSRRSAQIALFHISEDEWEQFAVAKRNCFEEGFTHRQQSNNSIAFHEKPARKELERIFDMMMEAGGSEPGFINSAVARSRAPWWYGCNPCVEILLGDKSFCNLVEIDIAKFRDDHAGLLRAIYIAGRANYRQTCVDLRDGVLQEAWHLNNEFMRLMGVGLTGIAQRDDLTDYELIEMQREAIHAGYSMADALGTQRPKNVTCVKPSGTLSKIMDTTEGVHKPLGKYIFNWINFGRHDPLVEKLRAAGYEIIDHPSQPSSVLAKFPVCWENVDFTTVEKATKSGEVLKMEVNTESAVDQLNRYGRYQRLWTQQNTSVTISYSPEEVPEIIDWLLENWDIYVGVSFLYRTDPTMLPEDIGYPYLPQEVTTKEKFDAYASSLGPVDFSGTASFEELQESECAGGACPIK